MAWMPGANRYGEERKGVIMDPATAERLRNGAALLGKLWSAGERCASGWGLEMKGVEDTDGTKEVESWACRCPERGKFCKAKIHWLKLALIELRDPLDGPFGLAEMMTPEEWDLTGRTRKVEVPGIGTIGLGGPNGLTGATDWAKLREAPECLESIVRLLKAFPKAKIEAVEQPGVRGIESDQVEKVAAL